MPNVPAGIQGIPASTIPTDPAAFVSWFTSVYLPRWAPNADVRNAVQGAGISISGSISAPATIAVNSKVQALFAQPFVLVGSPVAPATLTDYRSIATQSGVLSLTDGGAESTLTLGVVSNGIGNTQLRQGAATSVIGNATAATANVGDITATTNGQVLQMSSGTLSFATLSPGSLAPVGNDTVLGNVSGSSSAPTALTQAQLTSLVNVATASLSGACPVLSGTATTFLNGSGAFSTPAYPTGANPSGNVGLTAVNGSAATFMRSDAAPALSQAISPTWTGNHVFTPTSGVPIVLNSLAATEALDINAPSANAPYLAWKVNGTIQGYTGFAGAANQLCVGSAAGDLVLRTSGALRVTTNGGTSAAVVVGTGGTVAIAAGLGVNGATPPTQVTGWGTPTGGSVVANFNGASGSLVNCSNAIAELITILKGCGIIGA